MERLTRELGPQGPKRLLTELVALTVYRRVVLLERMLREPVPEVEAQVLIQASNLDESQIADYLAFLPHTRPQEVARRLAEGHRCFVARCQADLAAVCWTSTSATWTRLLDATIPVAPGEVYLYGVLTVPARRGKGVAPQLVAHVMSYFGQAGYHRMITAIEPENLAAMEVSQKLGFRPYGCIRSYRLGPWHRCVHQDSLSSVPLERSR